MTWAEELMQEGERRGIEKGLTQGRNEGRNEGEHNAALKIARTMLENGLDKTTVLKMTGLTEQDLLQLHH